MKRLITLTLVLALAASVPASPHPSINLPVSYSDGVFRIGEMTEAMYQRPDGFPFGAVFAMVRLGPFDPSELAWFSIEYDSPQQGCTSFKIYTKDGSIAYELISHPQKQKGLITLFGEGSK